MIGIDKYLSGAVSSAEVGVSKPNPEIFEAISGVKKRQRISKEQQIRYRKLHEEEQKRQQKVIDDKESELSEKKMQWKQHEDDVQNHIQLICKKNIKECIYRLSKKAKK